MKNILVVGRHPLDNIQIAELEEAFGDDIEITMNSQFIRGVDGIVSMYKNGGFDAIVTMLPLNMIAQLASRGICPVRSNRPNAIHSGFDVVKKVVVDSMPLKDAIEEGYI